MFLRDIILSSEEVKRKGLTSEIKLHIDLLRCLVADHLLLGYVNDDVFGLTNNLNIQVVLLFVEKSIEVWLIEGSLEIEISVVLSACHLEVDQLFLLFLGVDDIDVEESLVVVHDVACFDLVRESEHTSTVFVDRIN